MNDPRESEVQKIKLPLLRINRKPPIIFLCGGRIDDKGGNGISARNSFIYHLATNNHPIHDSITIAESFKDWMNGSVYKDLMEFESDIAGISSIIVLILESPGALTELGLFVADKILKKKTVAFMSSKHYTSNSFIRLGPIEHIKKEVNEKHVCAYDWDTNKIETLKVEDIELMRVDLEEIITKMPNTEKIDTENAGHLALLIFELAKVFRALLISEISAYLSIIVGKKVRKKTVKRSLFLLDKFRLIEIVRKGNYDYYLPAKKEIDNQRIDFSGSLNLASATLESRAYYELKPEESRRLDVITKYFHDTDMP